MWDFSTYTAEPCIKGPIMNTTLEKVVLNSNNNSPFQINGKMIMIKFQPAKEEILS